MFQENVSKPAAIYQSRMQGSRSVIAGKSMISGFRHQARPGTSGRGRQWLLALALVCPVLGQSSAWAEEPAAQPQEPELTSAQRQACNRAAFRIAIDVGHTRESPGAVSAHGIDEYDFNLRLGRVVIRALRDAGFAKATLMVTDGPALKSLFVRVQRAASLNAQLYLSLHHDSVPEIFKQRWQEDGRVLSYCDRFSGHSIFISHDNPDRAGSLMFARLLGQRMKAHGLTYTRHYTEKFMGSRQRELLDADAGVYSYDKLIVLRATRMPAVLLEGGMIVNRTDAPQLADPARQALISAAVVEAADAFCAARSGHSPQLLVTASHVERSLAKAKKRAHQQATKRVAKQAKKQAKKKSAVRPIAMKREPDRRKQ
jgi:N-acetylmuramoyl-L-alanine amidase